LDHRARMLIKKRLPENATSNRMDEALGGALVTVRLEQQLAHDSAQPLEHRAHVRLRDGVEPGSRLYKFAHKQRASPNGLRRVEAAQHERADEAVEALLCGRFGSCAERRRVFLQRALAERAQHLEVELLFVAEVIINGGDVGGRALADLAHRSGSEAP